MLSSQSDYAPYKDLKQSHIIYHSYNKAALYGTAFQQY